MHRRGVDTAAAAASAISVEEQSGHGVAEIPTDLECHP